MRSEPSDTTGFRALLGLGAAVSVAIGIWGVVWTQMLETVLGLDIAARSLGVSRLYGGVMLAIGVGYGLAAAQPHRNRSLLVPLFIVPLITAVVVIMGAARGEIDGARGATFAIYNAAFCLLFFRLYPRVAPVAEPTLPPAEPPST